MKIIYGAGWRRHVKDGTAGGFWGLSGSNVITHRFLVEDGRLSLRKEPLMFTCVYSLGPSVFNSSALNRQSLTGRSEEPAKLEFQI